MEEYRFQVNLKGMIEILSDHLYSSPDVYIRELLQNGTDAIVAREKEDDGFCERKEGRLTLTLVEGKSLHFRDNGVGLTKEEINRFLAIIGESSKKDISDGKIPSDYIGRFGIGMLSCFMVSDEIRIHTKSVKGDQCYEWVGRPDGTYTLTTSDFEMEPGTDIFLTAKKGSEEYYTREKVESLVLHYGLILPYPIIMESGEDRQRINPTELPWRGEHVNKKQLMDFGRLMFDTKFLDCIPLHSKDGEVEGVAYILPYPVQPSTKQRHMIYLKNMLLTDMGDNILPEWAVFTKCIINAKSLRPTASREGFYEDGALKQAKAALGKCISNYLKNLAENDRAAYAKFLDVHSLAIKSIAIDDDELYQIFIDELEFITTRGTVTGKELRMSREALLYCGMEQYRRLSQIFAAQNRLLINVGYVYDRELLLRMEDFFNVAVAPISELSGDDLLKDVSLREAESAVDFLKIADRALAPFNCNAEIKQFVPENLPAFYFLNEYGQIYQEIWRIEEEADEIFSGMLREFSEEYEEKAVSTLYFNLKNPLVQKLIHAGDVRMAEDYVIILYIQTLLIGGFPLRKNELGIMNDKILSIMDLTLSDYSGLLN